MIDFKIFMDVIFLFNNFNFWGRKKERKRRSKEGGRVGLWKGDDLNSVG